MFKLVQFLNDAHFDVVCLQHEYEIFAGDAGRNIIELLSRLEMPIVTTLHTGLAKPALAQHDVMSQIVGASAKIIVMSEKGHELLRSVHNVPARKSGSFRTEYRIFLFSKRITPRQNSVWQERRF